MLLKETVSHQLKLRFFDTVVNLKSDSLDFIERFEQLYSRFVVSSTQPLAKNALEFTVLASADNRWGYPTMLLNGEAWPLRDHRLLEEYVYSGILYGILSQIQSHFLIHAGVVSKDGQGFVIVADSFHGKTTLVLELVRRGFEFLSDETAAISRSDGLVHPFPRSLRIRSGSLELVGLSDVVTEMPTWLGKFIVDINEIRPGSMGKAVPVSNVVVLQNPDYSMNKTMQQSGVLVDRLDENLLTSIRQIEGVTQVRTELRNGYPTIWFCTTREMFALSQIEMLCRENRVLMLRTVNQVDKRPTFQSPAHLEPFPNSKAVLELLQRFQGGHKSALLGKEFGGSSTRLYMELAALISRARCYRLFVGPLRETADLISGLVDKN